MVKNRATEKVLLLILLLLLPSLVFAHHIVLRPRIKMLFKKGDIPPSFSLISQAGRKVSLKDWRGKIVVLSFTQTDAPDMLTEVLISKFVNLQIEFENTDTLGKDLVMAAVTVNPKMDTIDVLREYANRKRMDSKGIFLLTGDPDDVIEVLKDYGVFTVKEGHGFVYPNLLTMIIGRDGRIMHVYYGEDAISNRIMDDVIKILKTGE